MKLVEVGTDDVSGGTLVVVEHPNGKRHTWVQEPESLWRDVVTGEFLSRLDESRLEPLLWLHRREEARKSAAAPVKLILEGLGQALASAHLVTGGAGGGGSCTVPMAQGAPPGGWAGQHGVDLPRCIMAFVVESPETVDVRGGDGSAVRVEPGQSFAVVDPEISTQALQHLAASVGAMLERRMRGGE